MKNICIKAVAVLSLLAGATGCVGDDDYSIPKVREVLFSEDFNSINYNQNFDYPGWTNFAEAGGKVWTERDFNNDGYIQFSSYQSGDASNIGWAISPAIAIPDLPKLVFSFSSASNFVDSADNKLEVFISENYDGTNVLAATWTKLNVKVADNTTNSYIYVDSGLVDMTPYIGKSVHIAFKASGSNTLAGLFQVDKIRIYSNID